MFPYSSLTSRKTIEFFEFQVLERTSGLPEEALCSSRPCKEALRAVGHLATALGTAFQASAGKLVKSSA